jgi:hypothetical protein
MGSALAPKAAFDEAIALINSGDLAGAEKRVSRRPLIARMAVAR